MCVQEPTATVSDIEMCILRSLKYLVKLAALYIFCCIQVTNVRKQEKLKYPPHPLNTIELEKRASRYFRMSSEHTMKVSNWLRSSSHL